MDTNQTEAAPNLQSANSATDHLELHRILWELSKSVCNNIITQEEFEEKWNEAMAKTKYKT